VPHWTETNVPDQNGRVALITGANSGIGWDTARVLAAKGARVILACRSRARGTEALQRLEAVCPNAEAALLEMDLADLDSVRQSAARFSAEHDKLDLLVNNAGLMAIPKQQTAQGFEMQFGVNHLGHFALTGLLLPTLLRTRGARVVNVSSNGHRPGRIRFEDLHWESRYNPWAAYFQSKLANLLFTYELQRKLEASGASAAALAAHPGATQSNLGHENPGGLVNSALYSLRPLIQRFLLQSSAMGALPTLRAAADPDARGGQYYGPRGLGEMAGPPVRVGSSRRARDVESARRLWQVSEELTGVKYDFAANATTPPETSPA
jgi:NAD(P)-dependent dehydrogenase (short-subunit alcohol dehydrogenase family)